MMSAAACASPHNGPSLKRFKIIQKPYDRFVGVEEVLSPEFISSKNRMGHPNEIGAVPMPGSVAAVKSW